MICTASPSFLGSSYTAKPKGNSLHRWALRWVSPSSGQQWAAMAKEIAAIYRIIYSVIVDRINTMILELNVAWLKSESLFGHLKPGFVPKLAKVIQIDLQRVFLPGPCRQCRSLWDAFASVFMKPFIHSEVQFVHPGILLSVCVPDAKRGYEAVPSKRLSKLRLPRWTPKKPLKKDLS